MPLITPNKLTISIEAEDRASAQLKKINGELDRINGELDQMEQNRRNKGGLGFDIVELQAATAFIEQVGTALFEASKEIYAFGRAGAEIERMAASFELVAGGTAKSTEMLEKLRAASNGTISDMELMATANRAIMLGVTNDAEEMAKLLQIAAVRGRAMGVSTTKAFEDISTGIGRGSAMILDNLGIVVDSKKNYEDYARIIGKTAAELTKEEKAQALLNAVLQDGNRILAEAGGLAVDNLSAYERLEASWTNYTNALKTSIGSDINPLVDGLGELLETATAMQGKFKRAPLWTYLFPPAAAVASIVNIVEGMNDEVDVATRNYTAMAEAQELATDASGNMNMSLEEQISLLEEQERTASQANQTFLGLVDQFVNLEGRSAEEVEKSTRRIVLSMLERQLAMDGLNKAETNYLLDLGVKWGVYTESAASEARKAMAEVARLSSSFSNLPGYRSMVIDVMLTGSGAQLVTNESVVFEGVKVQPELRAGGGPVMAGSPYIVGEQGAELFVPGQSGTIIPNSQMGGVVVNMTYAPAISLASAQEAQDVLLPFIRDGVNNVLAGR